MCKYLTNSAASMVEPGCCLVKQSSHIKRDPRAWS